MIRKLRNLMWWLLLSKYKQQEIVEIQYRINWRSFDEKGQHVADMKTKESKGPGVVPNWTYNAIRVEASWEKMARYKGKSEKWVKLDKGLRVFER